MYGHRKQKRRYSAALEEKQLINKQEREDMWRSEFADYRGSQDDQGTASVLESVVDDAEDTDEEMAGLCESTDECFFG